MLSAENESARSVLVRALDGTHRRLTWALGYGPDERTYYLSVGLPSMVSRSQFNNFAPRTEVAEFRRPFHIRQPQGGTCRLEPANVQLRVGRERLELKVGGCVMRLASQLARGGSA